MLERKGYSGANLSSYQFPINEFFEYKSLVIIVCCLIFYFFILNYIITVTLFTNQLINNSILYAELIKYY